nr:MAG TPA: hypothetical protein [Caudoviricetes sp.]
MTERMFYNLTIATVVWFLLEEILVNEKEFYRERIIEMVKKIDNVCILKLIYGFVKSGYNEEKAGK